MPSALALSLPAPAPAHAAAPALSGAPCSRRAVPPRLPRAVARPRRQRVLPSARAPPPDAPDDFKGSRRATLALLRRCDALSDPARAGLTTQEALAALVNACIYVWELGFSEDSIRAELDALTAASADAFPSSSTIRLSEAVILVFITLQSCPPRTVTRWSSTAPVSARSLACWHGFCSLISDAYFNKGFAWFPINRLQLEQSATLGHAEPAPVIAERMSLVYQTLNTVAPRFPSMFD